MSLKILFTILGGIKTAVRVAINGFGRIGRLAFRQMFGAEGYEVVAINDLTSPKMLAHLLKYDSSQGKYEHADEVSASDDSITVCGKEIKIYAFPDANNCPWGELKVDVVLECSGFYTSKEKAQAHINAGARKVVISAPAGNDPDWYDYTAKKWANAKTSDGSMWVWIPRYAYSITSGYHSSSAGNIEVEFMKGTSNKTSTGRTGFQNVSGQGKWNIHPAFNYGSTVSGLWVAKFEASRSNATSGSAGDNNTIKIQPGVSSWTDIAVKDIFKTCRNYNTLLNSHMMKNTEWGAVAYFSKSKYGINGEVAINSFNYTGGGSDNSYVDNTDQSTTGNVWGIYDMSGGKYEYVAAYVNNGSSILNTYGSSLVSASSYMKDIYTASKDTSSENYNESSSKYGDALYETSSDNSGYNSWYDDYSLFPSRDEPFFRRGGAKDDRTHTGVFCFDYSDGDEYYASTFRPVLI